MQERMYEALRDRYDALAAEVDQLHKYVSEMIGSEVGESESASYAYSDVAVKLDTVVEGIHRG